MARSKKRAGARRAPSARSSRARASSERTKRKKRRKLSPRSSNVRQQPPERLALDWTAGAIALGVPPPHTARVVLSSVARTMNRQHETYTTEGALVSMTGLNAATVRRALSWLTRFEALVDRGPAPGFRADRAPRMRAFGEPVYNAAGASNRAASWGERGRSSAPPQQGTESTGAQQRAPVASHEGATASRGRNGVTGAQRRASRGRTSAPLTGVPERAYVLRSASRSGIESRAQTNALVAKTALADPLQPPPEKVLAGVIAEMRTHGMLIPAEGELYRRLLELVEVGSSADELRNVIEGWGAGDSDRGVPRTADGEVVN